MDPTTPAPERDRAPEEPPPEEPPQDDEPPLLSCLDALGRLFRIGFWIVLAAATLSGAARAHGPGPPARVWVDGHDIDGPPPGPVHVPRHLGFSVWPTNVRTRIKALSGATAPDIAATDSVTGVNATVFGRSGFWWGELDLFTLDQTTSDPLVLGGTTFTPGAALTQNDVVARVAREIHRFELPWGFYLVDAGIRFTMANRTLADAGVEFDDVRMLLSPEILIRGRHVFDETFALHTRSSFATDGGGSDSETSVEFQATLNYHVIETPYAVHDLGIGLRYLSQKIGYTDDATLVKTVYRNIYLGPEISYACRW